MGSCAGCPGRLSARCQWPAPQVMGLASRSPAWLTVVSPEGFLSAGKPTQDPSYWSYGAAASVASSSTPDSCRVPGSSQQGAPCCSVGCTEVSRALGPELRLVKEDRSQPGLLGLLSSRRWPLLPSPTQDTGWWLGFQLCPATLPRACRVYELALVRLGAGHLVSPAEE